MRVANISGTFRKKVSGQRKQLCETLFSRAAGGQRRKALSGLAYLLWEVSVILASFGILPACTQMSAGGLLCVFMKVALQDNLGELGRLWKAGGAPYFISKL